MSAPVASSNRTAVAVSTSSGDLSDLVRETKQCALIPSTFFVAWHGVLALVFQGFPSPLQHLKSHLNEREKAFGFQPEQMGSKWPKVTLGCLREDRTLTEAEAKGLLKICTHYREHFLSEQWRMHISHLSYARFANRTLQQIVFRADIPLGQRESESETSVIPSEEAARVSQIVNEFNEETLPAYLQHINKPGGRYDHYNSLFNDASLVAFCSGGSASNHQEPQFLQQFRAQVDQLLPGAYQWFPWSALHVTIRAM